MMTSTSSKIIYVLITVFSFNIILGQTKLAVLFPYFRQLEGLFSSLEQPYPQIIAKFLINLLSVTLILVMYLGFELLHNRVFESYNQNGARHSTEEDVGNNTSEPPILATILYKPMLITAFVMGSIITRIEVFPDEPGGTLNIGRYVLVALIFFLPLIIYFGYSRIHLVHGRESAQGQKYLQIYDIAYKLIFALLLVDFAFSFIYYTIILSTNDMNPLGDFIRSNFLSFGIFPLYLVIGLVGFGLFYYMTQNRSLTELTLSISTLPKISILDLLTMYVISYLLFFEPFAISVLGLFPTLLILVVSFLINFGIILSFIYFFDVLVDTRPETLEQGYQSLFIVPHVMVFLLVLTEFYYYSMNVINI